MESLKSHPLFTKTYLSKNNQFQQFLFKDNTMYLNVLIPLETGGELKWHSGFNNGTSFFSSQHYSHDYPKLISVFKEIVKEAESSLENRDKLRRLFK